MFEMIMFAFAIAFFLLFMPVILAFIAAAFCMIMAGFVWVWEKVTGK
mgnify:CR=1 FL=1